jgi:hypothetical protein
MEITVNQAIATPDFDLEALKRSLQRGAPLRNRAAAQRSGQREFAAATRQIRQETIQTLEGELSRAGVDVRKLRETLAHHRNRTRDTVAALRSRVATSTPSEPPAMTATNSRLRSLRALAGRTIPLDQPTSLTFLNEPFFFSQDSEVPTAVSVSFAPNNVFFRASVNHVGAYLTLFTDFGFGYFWYNDSDSAMLVDVVTGLELYGDLNVSVQDADIPFTYCSTRGRVGGWISLGSLDDPFMESSQQSFFADVHVSTYTFGDEADWYFADVYHRLSLGLFLVPPRSPLVITVSTEFRSNFNFDDDSSGNYAFFDFFSFPNLYRIGCPGVVVLASPVTLF